VQQIDGDAAALVAQDAAALVAKCLEAKGFGRAWGDVSGTYFGVMCEGPSETAFFDLSSWPKIDVIGKAYELNRDGDIMDKTWEDAGSVERLDDLDPKIVWEKVAALSFYEGEDDED